MSALTVVYIICAIIAVIAGILLQSLIFTVDYGDDFTVYLRFLFIKIRLFPQKDKKKKKNNVKNENGKKQSEVKKKVDKSIDIKGFADTFNEYRTAFRPIINALGGFCRHIRIYPLKIRAVLAGKDAADLAIDYGRLCAVFYPSLAWLCGRINIKRKNVYIGVDYLKPKYELEIFFKARIRLIFALGLAVKIIWQLVKIKLKSQNMPQNSGGDNNHNQKQTERTCVK